MDDAGDHESPPPIVMDNAQLLAQIAAKELALGQAEQNYPAGSVGANLVGRLKSLMALYREMAEVGQTITPENAEAVNEAVMAINAKMQQEFGSVMALQQEAGGQADHDLVGRILDFTYPQE